MRTISLRLNDTEYQLLQEYVAVNNLNMSAFVREAIMDKIESDFELDEERILQAKRAAGQQESYDHTDVWERLGI